jgi:DHA1 family bicyclomycin/chloramphenicol resistance-like MFS transporter
MLQDARELLGMRAFWGHAGNMACASGMFFAFAAGAPYVVQQLMGRSPTEYGGWFAILAVSYSIGNFGTGRFAQRLGAPRMIFWGTVLAGIGTVLFWLLAGWQHPAALFLPMALVSISNGMTLPSAMASAMGLSPRLAGSASGVAGALQMLFGATLSFLVGWYLVDSDLPLLVLLTVTFLASVGFYWLAASATSPSSSILAP